ncbi:MAG: hypothetical protein WD530_03565 [Vicingaceae bacterium]
MIFNTSLFAQNLEVIAGLNQNQFFDDNRDEGHYNSSYQSDRGFAVRIGIEDIKVDWLKLRFTMGFEQYGGEIDVSDGGQAGDYQTTAEIDKSVLSLGLFPLNFKIWERIDLNFGLGFSALLNESYRGTRSGSIWGGNSWRENLEERYDNYSNNTHWGLLGRLAYDFEIDDRYSISPQYSYYLGLSDEFSEFPEDTKSMRHYFSLGFQWKM